MAEPFRILFVCTGNVCRSPMAQSMLRHRLRDRLGDGAGEFEIASAGTGALVGEPIEPHAVKALADLGVDADECEGRNVSEQLLDEADLILTATKQHRSQVVSAMPTVVRRTFTIKEFARLAGSLSLNDIEAATDGAEGTDRVHWAVERVARQRGLLPPVPQHEDDVADPYRQPAKRFAQTAAELSPAIDVLAELLVRAALKESEQSRVAVLHDADQAEAPAPE
jgi:protein-tyrosine phosphatase